jgi:hypothetical protein
MRLVESLPAPITHKRGSEIDERIVVMPLECEMPGSGVFMPVGDRFLEALWPALPHQWFLVDLIRG